MKKILTLLCILFFTATVSADCTFDSKNIKGCKVYSGDIKTLNTILYNTFSTYQKESANKTFLAAKVGKLKKGIELYEQKILDGNRMTNRIEYIIDYLSFVIGVYLDAIENSKNIQTLANAFFENNEFRLRQITGTDLSLKSSKQPLELLEITPYQGTLYQTGQALQIIVKFQNNTSSLLTGLQNLSCPSMSGVVFSDITTIKAKPYKITNIVGYLTLSGYTSQLPCQINYEFDGTGKQTLPKNLFIR